MDGKKYNMKYIIAGGRDFNNYPALAKALNHFTNISEIVSGDARGADSLGMLYATARHIPVEHFPAQWNVYGKSAGFIRNAEMGHYADAAICFWDGKSRGTQHMISTMRHLQKPVYVFNYEGELMQ
jgi:hypothetical protein